MESGGDVLVVDDDADVRDALEEILHEAGFAVRVARDGAAALAMMKAHRPEMILLDLVMPNVDGWRVMSEMEGDPMLRSIPVCVLTGHGDKAPPNAARVLEKPIMVLPLLEVVERYCGSPRSPRP